MKILTIALIATTVLSAKPKTQSYPADCDRVWSAVKKVTAPPHYNFAQLDDKQKKGLVSTGNNISGKRYIDITLTGVGSACAVSIGGQFSGLIHNDKGDLFKRIQETLVESQASSVAEAK